MKEYNVARVRGCCVTPFYALLAITSADLGRMDEARTAVQVILDIDPKLSAKGLVNYLDFKDRAKSERGIATLLKLGLPEAGKKNK